VTWHNPRRADNPGECRGPSAIFTIAAAAGAISRKVSEGASLFRPTRADLLSKCIERVGFFLVIVSAQIYFSAQVACAHSASASRQTSGQGPAFCDQSTLSADTFMPLVSKIIAHGDLTDVEFIEKTLNIKLSMREGVTPDGDLDPYSPFYQADYFDGTGIHIDIFTWGAKATQKNAPYRAIIVFKNELVPANFIEHCFRISVHNFIAYFGGAFATNMVATGGAGGSIVGGSQVDGSRGKHGSRVYLSYSVDANTQDVISGVEIKQTP